jgi:hypothetical protein
LSFFASLSFPIDRSAAGKYRLVDSFGKNSIQQLKPRNQCQELNLAVENVADSDLLEQRAGWLANSRGFGGKLGSLARLAGFAEEGTALRLNDSHNGTSMTSEASLTFTSIDAMVVLISPFAIDRIAICSIVERRAFVSDRIEQNLLHRTMDRLPGLYRDPITFSFWMDA